MAIAKINDTISWKSSYTLETKEGVVRAIIPAGANPLSIFPQLKMIRTSCVKLGNQLCSSKNERYLVEIPRKGISGQELPSHWYGPKTNTKIEILGENNGN